MVRTSGEADRCRTEGCNEGTGCITLPSASQCSIHAVVEVWGCRKWLGVRMQTVLALLHGEIGEWSALDLPLFTLQAFDLAAHGL